MKKLIFLILFSIICTGCDDFFEKTYKLNLINNTTHKLIFYRGTMSESFQYPDTLITDRALSQYGIPPKRTMYLGGFLKPEDLIKELPKDTLSIYFFHPDTIKKYSWENIRSNYRVLKRYDLSIQDIQLLDYEIPYPPSEQMKNMRMYPLYGK